MGKVTIQNRLEVLLGNKLLVPGCEPTSAFTSPTLAENRECNATVVDLGDALEAIPGSTIISWQNPRRLFFVLPEGPPNRFGCIDTTSVEDYYAILRGIGEPADMLKTIVEVGQPSQTVDVATMCDAFQFKGIF